MVLEKVKAILSEQFDVEEDSITAETTLADDLGADSLDVVDRSLPIQPPAGGTGAQCPRLLGGAFGGALHH